MSTPVNRLSAHKSISSLFISLCGENNTLSMARLIFLAVFLLASSYTTETLLARDQALENLQESLQNNREEKEITLDSLSHFSDEHLQWLKDHRMMEKLTLIGAPHARYRQAFNGSGFQYLKDLPKLREIVLGDMQIESFEQLGQLENVRVLRFLGTCQIPQDQWRYIGQMTKLEELDLKGACINDQGLYGLRTLQNVKVMRIEGSLLVGSEIYHLVSTAGVEHLKNIASLEVLDLDGFKIGQEAGKYLVGLKNMRELRIATTSINDGCTEAIANMPMLTEARLGTISAKTIDVIAAHPKLKTLHFDGGAINDADLQKLAASRSLQSLSVSSYWVPKASIAYVRELPFMSRDERLTYGLLRYLLAESEAYKEIERIAEVAPFYGYVPPAHHDDVSGEQIDPTDPRHPRHADYIASFQEGVSLLGDLKMAQTGSMKRMVLIAAAARQASERAFADDPEQLKWALRLIESTLAKR